MLLLLPGVLRALCSGVLLLMPPLLGLLNS
jgi:hypothetical protein